MKTKELSLLLTLVRGFLPGTLIFVCYSFIVASLSAQEGGDNDQEEGATFELNPFTVTTTGDVGYLAQNSLSGSRLNTRLVDLAVPTTAFTQELIRDIGSTSVDELAEYMVSTRPDYPEGENLYWGDAARRFRIRGLPAFSNSINFFETNLRLDHYNTERVEQSRGPNSILFGLGSPGGVVNILTKRADTTLQFGSIEFRVHDQEGLRSVLDVNQPLIDKTWALRVAAVWDHEKSWRHHEYDNQERLYMTSRWQISPRTRLDVEWERGVVDKSRAFPRLVADGYTPWVDAGSHLSDTPAPDWAVQRLFGGNWFSFNTETGQMQNWKLTTVSSPNRVGGVNKYLSDFSILPKEVVIKFGPAFPQKTDYTRASAFFTHSFTPDLSIEIAANYQHKDHDHMAGRGYSLQVDTNETLPNGEPNPNAGRAFVEGFPGLSWAEDRAKNVRASAAYELDLGRLGNHKIAALYQKDWIWGKSGQMRPQILVNPPNTSQPSNGQNRILFRTYVDLDGPAKNITAGDWRRFDLSNIPNPDTGEIMQAEFINYIRGVSDNRFERDSAIGVLQSSFWEDRLVTVVGYRTDWQDSWLSPFGVRGEPFPPFDLGNFEAIQSDTPVDHRANNLTYSGLFRVVDWLALTYNRAENSALPDERAAVVGPDGNQRPPAPRGTTQDWGFKVNLGHRLSLHALYFETTAEKDTANVNANIERRYPIIWQALDDAGIPAPDGGSALEVPSLFNRYTFDSSSHGYEVELVANPTDNWRIFLNYSYMVLERTRIGLEGRAYLEKYRDYWTEDDRGRILTDGTGALAPQAMDGDDVVETVAEEIAAIDQEIHDFYVITDGEQPRGQNKHRFNLRTNYTFGSGMLDGFSVGGGLRYRSGAIIAYQVEDTGSGVVTDVQRGRENILVDLQLRYQGKSFELGGREIDWSVQLNVDNVLDETDILPLRAVDGEVVSYRFQPPRQFFLTTRFSF